MTRPSWLLALVTVVALATGLGGGVAHAQVTAAAKCQRAKNLAAGTHAACRHKAAAKFAVTGDAAARAAALTKCADKLGVTWGKEEARALDAAQVCRSRTDLLAIEQEVDDLTDDVASRLDGGPSAGCLPELAACTNACPATTGLLATGQGVCWTRAGFPTSCSVTQQDGRQRRGLARAWVDNGDGTVTDARTGLTWEKLSDDGGIHDKDTLHTWEDGFAVKVAALNVAAFAGHTDWRMPNLIELETLRDLGAMAAPMVSPALDAGCVPGCTVLDCSCAGGRLWSSSTHEPGATSAWVVSFDDGSSDADAKTVGLAVRAVRGGS